MEQVEIFETFRSRNEWEVWNHDKPYLYDSAHLLDMAERIASSGLTEPITERQFSSNDIVVSGPNFRESIEAGGIISRHRALLLELARSYPQSRLGWIFNASIFAPEAVTSLALWFRGRFPRFLGSEYLPDAGLRLQNFPISHEDVTSLSFATGAFDVYLSNDVLEHVPNIDAALAETFRVLKPGGIAIQTFPFASDQDSGVVRAKLINGKVVNILPPEYHGNPIDPSGGSLVFEVPAWDLVKRALDAGFADAYFRFICSEHHGIIGGDICGAFVFVASKR